MNAQDTRSHRPALVVTAAAAAAIVLAASPVLAQRGDRRGGSGPGRGPGEFTAEQTDQVIRTLPIGASGSLELRNMAGNIAITAAPGREARVEIIRRARGRTPADAAAGLELTQVAVEHTGDRAVVAVAPKGERRAPYFVTVTYIVSAPPGTRITASSLSGNVAITDIKGELNVQVTRGNVEIRRAGHLAMARTIAGDVLVSDLESDRGLLINALSGNVHLERVRARRVEVDVTSGDVRLRGVSSDTVRVTSLSGSIEFASGLMAGGRYHFQAHSGHVRLILTGPTGLDLQASTFSGNLRLDPSLKLTAPLQSRGTFRGTVGDGAAMVVVNSFRGDIEIRAQP
jgi:DUF4097 and DUF4098 domain-containing protein YvlB